MQYSMSFPFSYTYLNKYGNLQGYSSYLSIGINSDPFVNGEAIECLIKKKMTENWRTLWMSGWANPNNENKVIGNGFEMEILDPSTVWFHDEMEDQIQMDLSDEGLDCNVEILGIDPNEERLFGIDFICPSVSCGGGCLLVDSPIPMPEGFLDAIHHHRGKWLLHSGLAQDLGDRWQIRDKKYIFTVDKDRVLMGTTPFQALASSILKEVKMEKIKLRFLEGTRLVFNSDSI